MKQNRAITTIYLLRPLAVMVLLCLFLSSCTHEEEYTPAPLRTILFYMGGDNNLSGEVDRKIERLQNATVPVSCHLLVYSDSRKSNPQLWEAGNGSLTLVREYDESNSADAEVFGSVMREVMQAYPAPSYGLVLFSHASGWMPEGTYNNPALRSVVIDNGAEMDIPDFAATIPDKALDFIVFEACFMAGIEVAYELKDKTRYIVGSSAELVSPGFMPSYGDALPYLFKPNADLTGFCRVVEADYLTRSGDYGSLTLSLIDTKGVNEITEALRGVSLPVYSTDIQTFSRYGKGLFFDLYDSYSALEPARLTDLQAAISASVIWKSATDKFMPTYGGFEVNAHSGLTTYIPQADYPKLNTAYQNLKWYKEVLE